MLELRRAGDGGHSLQDRWLLAVQRRHSCKSSVRAKAHAQRRSAGSGRERPRPRFADFTRYGLPDSALGRSGVPDIVADEAARREEDRWAARAPPMPAWPRHLRPRSGSLASGTLSVADFRKLVFHMSVGMEV